MPRPKNDDGYTVTCPSNGDREPTGRPWGRIAEISAFDIPSHMAGPWTLLYRELLLRLEKTPPTKALAIPFQDEPTLRRAAKATSAYFREHHGSGVVLLNTAILDDGTAMLYVRRGENWNHRRDPDDVPIPTEDDLPPDSESIEEETHEQDHTHQRGRRGSRRGTQGG